MKILILSDVHGNIKMMDEILEKHSNYDLFFFIGDFEVFSKDKYKLQLKKFDKIVIGNCDISKEVPLYDFFEFKNIKILITHGHMFSSFYEKIDFNKLNEFAFDNNANIILHGHDHIAKNVVEKGITRFNPGSITFPKNNSKPSYGTLEINNDSSFILKHHYIKK